MRTESLRSLYRHLHGNLQVPEVLFLGRRSGSWSASVGSCAPLSVPPGLPLRVRSPCHSHQVGRGRTDWDLWLRRFGTGREVTGLHSPTRRTLDSGSFTRSCTAFLSLPSLLDGRRTTRAQRTRTVPRRRPTLVSVLSTLGEPQRLLRSRKSKEPSGRVLGEGEDPSGTGDPSWGG